MQESINFPTEDHGFWFASEKTTETLLQIQVYAASILIYFIAKSLISRDLNVV